MLPISNRVIHIKHGDTLICADNRTPVDLCVTALSVTRPGQSAFSLRKLDSSETIEYPIHSWESPQHTAK